MSFIYTLFSTYKRKTFAYASKLLWVWRWKNILNSKKKRVHIIFLLHDLSHYEKISLKTLFSTRKNGIKLFFTFICKAEVRDIFLKYLTSTFPDIKNYNLLEYNKYPTIKSYLDSCKKHKYELKALVSSHLVFHPLWLEKSIDAAYSALKNKHVFSGFSSYNPNDFKLIDTLATDEQNKFIIKNGFSFNAIIFPYFIIKKIINKLNSDCNAKDFFEASKNLGIPFVFTRESYAEVHSYDIYHPFDDFQCKPNNLSFCASRVKYGWDAALQENIPKFNKLVLHINYGGLGDNLFLSHLPRIAKQIGGYKEVCLSKKSVFRNHEYIRLIWDKHPYLDGLTDEMGYYIEFLKFDTEKMNILSHIMHLHGLDDGNLFHEPEFYYEPINKPELKGKIIFDPNYVSDAGDNISSELIDTYFEKHNIKIDFQMTLRDKSVPASNFSEWLKSESLEDFCNIIASCKEVFCFASGTATLTSALKKKAFVFYREGFNKQFLHSSSNTYIKL